MKNRTRIFCSQGERMEAGQMSLRHEAAWSSDSRHVGLISLFWQAAPKYPRDPLQGRRLKKYCFSLFFHWIIKRVTSTHLRGGQIYEGNSICLLPLWTFSVWAVFATFSIVFIACERVGDRWRLNFLPSAVSKMQNIFSAAFLRTKIWKFGKQLAYLEFVQSS